MTVSLLAKSFYFSCSEGIAWNFFRFPDMVGLASFRLCLPAPLGFSCHLDIGEISSKAVWGGLIEMVAPLVAVARSLERPLGMWKPWGLAAHTSWVCSPLIVEEQTLPQSLPCDCLEGVWHRCVSILTGSLRGGNLKQGYELMNSSSQALRNYREGKVAAVAECY